MKDKLTTQEKEMEEYKACESEHWATQKKELFQLMKFYDFLGAKFTSFLEKGFKGAVK